MTTTTDKVPAIGAMRLAELQSVASAMGISGVSRMRKADLMAAIGARGGAGQPAAKGSSKAASQPSSKTNAGPAQGTGENNAGASGPSSTEGGSKAAPDLDAAGAGRNASRRRGSDGARERTQDAVSLIKADLEAVERRQGRRATAQGGAPDGSGEGSGQGQRGKDQSAKQSGQADNKGARSGQRSSQGGGQSSGLSDDDRMSKRRSRRDRYRDRKSRQQRPDDVGAIDEPEIREDDVLVPVAGILDVMDNYAFVRTSGYLPGPNDVYVSLGQVRKAGLREGDAIVGAVRQPREGEQPSRQQKFKALVRLDSVNGMDPEQARKRPEFASLTPLYPQERLRLETTQENLTTRVIDLVSPIGKGQRGLIVSPPKAGKTM
ncbi:MAG: Rho termination factor N-terminal domain-containing protein, partial [Bifidobacteriaceae bacterium]|nr:Rho termination factor N-terminal domain-containing protein [Bifidobacteriaceae bacterium]